MVKYKNDSETICQTINYLLTAFNFPMENFSTLCATSLDLGSESEWFLEKGRVFGGGGERGIPLIPKPCEKRRRIHVQRGRS